MNNEDQNIVVGSTDEKSKVAGSKAFPCIHCAKSTWVGPTCQQIIAAGADVICLQCYMEKSGPRMPLEGRPIEIPEGVLREFQAHSRRN